MATRVRGKSPASWENLSQLPAKARAAVPKRKRGTITKPLIMDVSAAMFQEKGYDRTSLDNIAKALSITKPSLYYHFSSKEDILLACIRGGYLHFQDELLRRDDTRLSGRERVRIFLEIYLNLISHDIGLSMIMADDRVMMDDAKKIYDNYRRALNNDLENRIKQGVEDGSLAVSETRITTYAIFGMFNWVSHWHFAKNSPSLESILERFFAVIFDGIGARDMTHRNSKQ